MVEPLTTSAIAWWAIELFAAGAITGAGMVVGAKLGQVALDGMGVVASGAWWALWRTWDWATSSKQA